MASSRRTDWRTLGVLALMYSALVGNFVLYQRAPLPLPIHILIGTLAIHMAFTIWHEGVHQTVSSVRWVNDAAGILGVFPYMAPFYLERWFHLQHHALLNRRDDPNFIYIDGPLWKLPLRYWRVLRYAKDRMRDDPRTLWQKRADRVPLFLVAGIYVVAWWQGMFWDVVLLWLVPVVLGKLIMDWYVNYLPHAGLPPHRFHGTRIIDVRWLTFALLCHNYHAVHHLWPAIPWHRYPATFKQKLDYLREHGVPIESRITWNGVGSSGRAGADPLAG